MHVTIVSLCTLYFTNNTLSAADYVGGGSAVVTSGVDIVGVSTEVSGVKVNSTKEKSPSNSTGKTNFLLSLTTLYFFIYSYYACIS